MQPSRAVARQVRRSSGEALRRTPLYEFHKEKGCKFVPFAGYSMPVQYTATGVLKEHTACRTSAALFDVSHMGQWMVRGGDRHAFLEHVTPIDFQQLKDGSGGLSVITTKKGGIVDDTVITKLPDSVYMVVNAGCQEKDLAHVLEHKVGDAEVEPLKDLVLLALQGPKAAEVLTLAYGVDLKDFAFMTQRQFKLGAFDCRITRCGYTGEDGFEISLPASQGADFAADLAAREGVVLAGLGARDSLRLEAGMCLYGNDISEDTTPIEAGLAWLVSKRRRESGGFVGSDVILGQLKAKAGEPGAYARKRVGLSVTGPPARTGAKVLDTSGKEVGVVTSGVPSPTLKSNIAMAYVDRSLQKAGTELLVEVRGKQNAATVKKMPFVPSNYYRI
eukprot:Hpha_TRINITY_DN14410_c0_g1::TRINITY_DN14410_c0_g1_i1::g.157430::m.157430/K00605/gcvT, AMT; aminomethyltransferase